MAMFGGEERTERGHVLTGITGKGKEGVKGFGKSNVAALGIVGKSLVDLGKNNLSLPCAPSPNHLSLLTRISLTAALPIRISQADPFPATGNLALAIIWHMQLRESSAQSSP